MIECKYCEGNLCLRLEGSETGCIDRRSVPAALLEKFKCPTCFRDERLPVPVCDIFMRCFFTLTRSILQYLITGFQMGIWTTLKRMTPLIFGHLLTATPSSFGTHLKSKLADMYSEVPYNVSSHHGYFSHLSERSSQLEHFNLTLNGSGVRPDRYMAPSLEFLHHTNNRANMIVVVETHSDEKTGMLCHGPAKTLFIAPIDDVSGGSSMMDLSWLG